MTTEDNIYRAASKLADDLDITVKEALEKMEAMREKMKDWTLHDVQFYVFLHHEIDKLLTARNVPNDAIIGDHLSNAEFAEIWERAKQRFRRSSN
jgi:hypothetical protein